MIWQIVLLPGLVTYVECAPDVATYMDIHPTTIELDFIGALAVAVSGNQCREYVRELFQTQRQMAMRSYRTWLSADWFGCGC
jgi:hypothetical protein